MSQPLEQGGKFRGRITSYGLWNPEGKKSTAVTLSFQVEDAWDADVQEWVDWREYEFEVEGDIWVISKTGIVAQEACNSLMRYAGWDGDLMSVAEMRWEPTPCQFSVNVETDQSGKYPDKYKAGFLKAWDAIPGAGKTFLDANQAKALASQYGPQFRALAGSLKQNAPVPTASKPSVPKKPATKPQQFEKSKSNLMDQAGETFDRDINAELAEAAEEEKDGIPF